MKPDPLYDDRFDQLPEWCERFIQALRYSGSFYEARRVAGVISSVPYRLRDKNPIFAELWEEARQEHIEIGAWEVVKRGMHGEAEPIVYQGQIQPMKINGHVVLDCCHRPENVCDCDVTKGQRGLPVPLTVNKKSDTLLMFHMKAVAPHIYRERHDAPPPEPATPKPSETDLEAFARGLDGAVAVARSTDDGE